MTTITTINKAIASSFDAGLDKDQVTVEVFGKYADVSLPKAAKMVSAWMKDNGMAVERISFTAAYYDWLVDADPDTGRTEAEAPEFMVEHGSENTLRHEKAWQKQRELVNRAFTKALES